MGTGEWKYDRAQNTLEVRSERQAWVLHVADNKIEGTLTFSDDTVFRRMTLRKEE